ncbi:MAG TPA: dihydropteroate synthase [Actinomycetota bacterium]|nr:dihydropteroate synthase [Actinomycetota bacterium]
MSGWRCGDRLLPTGERTLIMGVLNVTPDSFSDGGQFLDPAAAVEHALAMVAGGADIIDVGGESTRPGAEPVSEAEEAARVVPVIRALAAQSPVAISIDTTKAAVAQAALEAGAVIVNDVSALRADMAMTPLVQASGAGVVLMHMLGEPRTMQEHPRYGDVVSDVTAALAGWAVTAEAAGIPRECVALDPGIGFGKTLQHNLALLHHLRTLGALGYPVLVGPSRKSFIGTALGLGVEDRLEATLAVVAWCVAHGAAVVRVHDVQAAVRAVRMTEAIASVGKATPPADRVVLRGLEVFAFHGVHPEEQAKGQPFLIDVEAWLDLAPAAHSDDLSAALDYSRLAATLRSVATQQRYDLIETLAGRLAAAVLAEAGVTRAVVRVAKPQAARALGARDIAVEVVRTR